MLNMGTIQKLLAYYKDTIQADKFDSRFNDRVTNSFMQVLIGLYCPEMKRRGEMLKVFFANREDAEEGHEVPVINKFEHDSLYLIDYRSSSDSCKRIRHDVMYSTTQKNFKFEELKQIGAFYLQKQIKNRIVFVDKEHHVSLVFYDGYNPIAPIASEGFAGFLPIILPWISGFDFNSKEKNSSNKEAFQILKSLTVDCSILPIENQISKILKSADYKHFILNKFISFFPNSGLQYKLKVNEEKYRALQNEMSNLIEKITQIQESIDDTLLTRDIIMAKMQDSCDEELIIFLENNKEIVIENREEKYINFAVHTYLDFVDEDLCEACFGKDNAKYHVLDEICNDSALAKRFWRAVWIDRKYRIRVYGLYQIDDNALITKRSKSHANYPDRCGNPHTVMFSCFGNYAQQISSASRNHDFIAAFSAAVGITRNLNLADHIVDSKFATWLKQNPNVNIIETDAGEIISLAEALRRIKESE